MICQHIYRSIKGKLTVAYLLTLFVLHPNFAYCAGAESDLSKAILVHKVAKAMYPDEVLMQTEELLLRTLTDGFKAKISTSESFTEGQKQKILEFANGLPVELKKRTNLSVTLRQAIEAVYESNFNELELKNLYTYYSSAASQKANKSFLLMTTSMQKALNEILGPRIESAAQKAVEEAVRKGILPQANAAEQSKEPRSQHDYNQNLVKALSSLAIGDYENCKSFAVKALNQQPRKSDGYSSEERDLDTGYLAISAHLALKALHQTEISTAFLAQSCNELDKSGFMYSLVRFFKHDLTEEELKSSIKGNLNAEEFSSIANFFIGIDCRIENKKQEAKTRLETCTGYKANLLIKRLSQLALEHISGGN